MGLFGFIRHVARSVRRVFHSAKRAVRSAARFVRHAVSRVVHRVRRTIDKARSLFHRVIHKGRSIMHAMHNKIRNTISRVNHFVNRIKGYAKRVGTHIFNGLRRITDTVAKNPWKVIPIVGVPVLVGTAMVAGTVINNQTGHGSTVTGHSGYGIPGIVSNFGDMRQVFYPDNGGNQDLFWALLVSSVFSLPTALAYYLWKKYSHLNGNLSDLPPSERTEDPIDGVIGGIPDQDERYEDVTRGSIYDPRLWDPIKTREEWERDVETFEGYSNNANPIYNGRDPIASYIETQMEVIKHQNLSAAWVDAEKLKGFIDELKQRQGWERYKGLIDKAGGLVSGVEEAYHRWRLEIKKEQVREIIRSSSPFDDLALYFSTGMLSWEDAFDIVSWGHSIAGYIGLESKEQAFENIVRIKAEQMLELEDNMGTAEHPNYFGIFVQGVSSPFTVAGTALVGGELGIWTKFESFLSRHELLATGLKIGDYGFNAMYIGSVVDDLRKGNYEGVVRDIGFIGLVSGIQKSTKILEAAKGEYVSIKIIRELFGDAALQRMARKKTYIETYVNDVRISSAFNSRGASSIARKISKETGWPYRRILANLDTPGAYWEYKTVSGKPIKNIILREDLIIKEPRESFYSIPARRGNFIARYIEVLTHEMYHKSISEGRLRIPEGTKTLATKMEEAYVDILMRLKFLGGKIQ